MKKIYKNQLPNGMEVASTNVRVEDGNVFVDVELKKEFNPKDGDFCVSDNGYVFIFKNEFTSNHFERCASCYYGIDAHDELDYNLNYTIEDGRYATKEEKANFLSRIEKKYGQEWNSEKKCLEDIFNPKDGDFLVIDDSVFIYNGKQTKSTYGAYIGVLDSGKIEEGLTEDRWTEKDGCRFASKKEKSAFLSRLERECHKRWNPETKKLESIRWRAKKGEEFHCISLCPDMDICKYRDSYDDVCNEMYEFGNYFRTPEDANKVYERVKEIFKAYKDEQNN